MSVWKAREYWDGPRGQDGTPYESVAGLGGDLSIRCSKGCLCTVKLPENPASDVILVGTWNGILRGLYPEKTPYSSGQLLFEKVFDAPILQLEAGNFVMGANSTGSGGFQLAVLHPDKLAMFYYSTGKTDTSSTDLFPLRSYKLKASAYSLIIGPFGGIKGRQMLCVSTFDGRLTIIDQETVMESPVLEDFLLPGPMCYVAARDSFVIGTSSWTADCYTYSELASKAGMAASQTSASANIRKAWSYNCGEALLDIQCIPEAQKSLILMLGERNMFCLEPSGVMRTIRRLDFSACLLSFYPSVTDVAFNMIVASTAQTLYIYEDFVPKWTTQLPCPVVDVKIAKIAGGEGVVVTLAEDGHVSAWYLGTDPEIYEVKAVTTTRKFDEEELRNETVRLADLIRQSESETSESRPLAQAVPQLLLDIAVEEFSSVSFIFDPKSSSSQRSPMSRSKITVTPLTDTVLDDVSVQLQLEPPFTTNPAEFFLGILSKPAIMDFSICNTLGTQPSDVIGNVVVQCNIGGSVRIQQQSFRLPFTLIAQTMPLTKKAFLKLDFEVAPVPLRLQEVFPDFSNQNDDAGVSLDFYGVGNVTILISKKQESKVRIQSDNPGLLLLVAEEAYRRMSILHPESTFMCTSSLPAIYFQEMLEQKKQLRRSYEQQKMDLDAWTKQLFTVEKRFLTRLKDRDVQIVHKLEELLEATQDQIMNTLQSLGNTQENLETVSKAVSSTVSLMHWLIKLNNHKMSTDEKRILELVVHAKSDDGPEDAQSWEEQVSQAVAFYMANHLVGEMAERTSRGPDDLNISTEFLKRAYHGQIATGKPKRDGSKRESEAVT